MHNLKKLFFYTALAAMALGWGSAVTVLAVAWVSMVLADYLVWREGDDFLDDIFFAFADSRLLHAPAVLLAALGSIAGLQIVLIVIKALDWSVRSWWLIMLPAWTYVGMVVGVMLLMGMAALRNRWRRKHV